MRRSMLSSSARAVLAIFTVFAVLALGSCDQARELLMQGEESRSAEEQLELFDRMVFEKGYRKVSLVAVVDRTQEAEEQAASLRESRVRAALQSYLTRYRGAEVLEPGAELMEQVREQVERTGSAAVSAELGKSVAQENGAEVVVNAIITDQGDHITLVATTASEGRVLFAGDLHEWEKAAPSERGEAEE